MSQDSIEEVWWLAWTAFAVPHGHNVFLAQWQNYPHGQNFGVNGSMLALGVLFMPITKAFGPIVSWNIAVRFALAISASSMCLVLRRWVVWWPAAFVGGLLYGFSAYMLANAADYLFLTFVPLPPVFFLLLHEILVRQKWRPSRAGTLLAIVCVLQFFIWSEVLAGMVFLGVIATGLFLLVNRHRLQQVWWRYSVRAFLFGGVVSGALLVVPAVFTLYGPQNTHGSPTQGLIGNEFPPDLLGAIVPQFQWISFKGLTAMATRSFPFASAEYLGLPLIIVLACFAVFLRKPKVLLFAGVMALTTFILSLGSPLWINGHKMPVPLPWAVFTRLPLVGGFTPVRWSLFTSLFVAAMFAIGLDEFRRRLRATKRTRTLSPSQRAFAALPLSAVAAAVILPLIPAHTMPTTETNIPSFFTSTAVHAIPEGAVALTYPYPDAGNPGTLFVQTPKTMMLEQAAAGMRFKLLGGFGWFPSATGSHGVTTPAPLSHRSVQEILDGAYWNAPSERALLSQASTSADLRAVLGRYDVDAVILQLQGAKPEDVVRYVTATIGCPLHYSGVVVWLHVKQRLAERVPGRYVNSCS